jgi:hypothetical protein
MLQHPHAQQPPVGGHAQQHADVARIAAAVGLERDAGDAAGAARAVHPQWRARLRQVLHIGGGIVVVDGLRDDLRQRLAQVFQSARRDGFTREGVRQRQQQGGGQRKAAQHHGMLAADALHPPGRVSGSVWGGHGHRGVHRQFLGAMGWPRQLRPNTRGRRPRSISGTRAFMINTAKARPSG